MSVRQRPNDLPIELGTGVSRPLVIAAIGLGLLVLAPPVALYLIAGTRPATSNDLVQGSPAPQRAKAVRMPAWAESQPRVREALAVASQVETVPENLPAPALSEPLPAVVALKTEPTAAPPPPAVPPPVAAPARQTPPPLPMVGRRPSYRTEPPAPAKPVLPSLRGRSSYTEDDLRYLLDQVARDVDLETEKGTSAKLLEKFQATLPWETEAGANKQGASRRPKFEPVLELLEQRDDLKGLPVRNAAECQVSAKEATAMRMVSRDIRSLGAKTSRDKEDDTSDAKSRERGVDMVSLLEMYGRDWRDDVGARMLAQMIQAENAPVRLQLVKMLSATEGKSAGAALAQRAVFDLSPEVRDAAVKALKDRPREQYRFVLTDALRYPWLPIADHAAETLVALNDRDAALYLALLLHKPDPQAPSQDKDKKWVVPEMVRINHLGNCLLCHAPAASNRDPVPGLVPERDKPLPVVYYESRSGDFVRADVTYLKQDFSVVQPVKDPGKWPRLQRFDYLIRHRELSADEVARLRQSQDAADKPSSYPQREAVLWALRQLTGKDVGDKSEDWVKLLLPGHGATRDP